LKKRIVILLFILIGTATFLGWKVLKSSVPSGAISGDPKTSFSEVEWSPERIASDPEGYLVYSSQQVQQQIKAREKRLEQLSQRRAELSRKRDELLGKMSEVANFRRRLDSAYQRALDEDRWPVRLAGRTFDRERVKVILSETQQWLNDREPLAEAYNAAFRKMDETQQALRNDIRILNQLGERIALDIERVKINQGNAELDQLRKNESELASLSRTLAQMSEEQVSVPSDAQPTAQIDIDALLK
jgi:hypothetical protein